MIVDLNCSIKKPREKERERERETDRETDREKERKGKKSERVVHGNAKAFTT